MEQSDGIELILKGSFEFSINQYGLNYNNKEELKDAIQECWNEFELAVENMNRKHNILDIHLTGEQESLKIEPSEILT